MKIIIVNGSYRKNGATALILNEMYQQLKEYNDVDVEMIHVADLELKFCSGCCICYKTGECIHKDDIENISLKIANADGVILGSPTYAGNVSAQMKVIIDRGHFIMEQLLYGKYGISVTTYENYGGRDSAKILNKILLYSGAAISGTIISRNQFNSNPLEHSHLRKYIQKIVKRFYDDISGKRKYILQSIRHFIIFQIGIKPFVLQKGSQYEGVINYWRKRNIMGGNR